MNHTKRLKGIIERLDRDYTGMGGDAMFGDARQINAHYCATLERMNAPQIKRDRAVTRRALFVTCVAFGMTLAAVALSHGYERAMDAIAAPHLEGF